MNYEGESQQTFQRVAQKLYAFVQEFAAQHGYSVVVERGSDAAPVVWHAAANIDITEHVVKAYDQKYGPAKAALPESRQLARHQERWPSNSAAAG